MARTSLTIRSTPRAPPFRRRQCRNIRWPRILKRRGLAAPLPVSQTFTNLTAAQVSFIQASLGSGNATRIGYAVAYAHLASTGSQIALNGTSTLVNFLPGLGVPQGQVIASRFILSGQPIPLTRNAGGELV